MSDLKYHHSFFKPTRMSTRLPCSGGQACEPPPAHRPWGLGVGTGQALVKQGHGALQKPKRWDGAWQLLEARKHSLPAGRISQAQRSSQGGCSFQSLRNILEPRKGPGVDHSSSLHPHPGQGSPERRLPWNGRAEKTLLALCENRMLLWKILSKQVKV